MEVLEGVHPQAVDFVGVQKSVGPKKDKHTETQTHGGSMRPKTDHTDIQTHVHKHMGDLWDQRDHTDIQTH